MSVYHTNTIICLTDWVEQNLDRPLSLDDIAIKSGYTKWYIQRVFRSVTGCSIAAYIRARKLTNAALLVRLSSRSINDVAEKLHFRSPQSFCRQFHQLFGVTPLGYRHMDKWYSRGILMPFSMSVLDISVSDLYKYETQKKEVWVLREQVDSDSFFERMEPDELCSLISKRQKRFSLSDQNVITHFLSQGERKHRLKDVRLADTDKLNNLSPIDSALLILKPRISSTRRIKL